LPVQPERQETLARNIEEDLFQEALVIGRGRAQAYAIGRTGCTRSR
jgi:hypothetical protein